MKIIRYNTPWGEEEKRLDKEWPTSCVLQYVKHNGGDMSQVRQKQGSIWVDIGIKEEPIKKFARDKIVAIEAQMKLKENEQKKASKKKMMYDRHCSVCGEWTLKEDLAKNNPAQCKKCTAKKQRERRKAQKEGRIAY